MSANNQKPGRTIEHRGFTIPTFLYGTAWKEERTETLTRQAIEAGFLGIDTANQRCHYYEEGVGSAIQQILAEGKLQRSALFLQTKFTYASGQDHRLPYELDADYAMQVRQSFASSLIHLGISFVDSYILHGPSSSAGLIDADWEVWCAMEELHKAGDARLIGVSNINLPLLQELVSRAKIKPAFVQNRCFARMKWDAQVRQLCCDNDIIYQGFSLLTANRGELNHPEIQKIVEKYERSLAQVVFRFALQAGMIPLTGTTDSLHMQEDLGMYEFELSDAEVNTIENIGL
ncbi:aldo/keto reductase family protein [Candidatus Riflebacteria bacterium]